MAVSASLYHTLCRELAAVCPTVRRTSHRRLALLVVAMVASQTCVIACLAQRLHTLGLSLATAESLGRRLRRTMNDPHITVARCYRPLLHCLLARALPQGQHEPLLIAIDESTHQEWVHLLRATLLYRGSGIPLAWVTWPQNQAQDDGAYWGAMDRLLQDLAACLPAGVPVVILADRAYAVASMTDRITAQGWHWAIRITTTGKHRWCDQQGPPMANQWGPDQPLAEVILQALPHPGTRFRASGRFAKKVGWRSAHLVGVWGQGQAEPLVVVTDLPARWLILAWYRRRFWTEARFRDDKSAGWNWERSQVREPAHHEILLLAMAWATLLSLWQGAVVAQQRLATTIGRRGRPTHARESLARLGREALIAWVYGRARPPARRRIPWHFPHLTGSTWSMAWSATLARHYIFRQSVRP